MIKYLILTLLFLPSLVFTQSRSISIADINQDIALMRKEIGQLRLEVEQLRRENDSLKSSQSGSVSSDLVLSQNSIIKSEFDSKLQAQKADIMLLVKKELDSMATQTNTAIQQVVSSLEARPSTSTAYAPTVFSDDYPQRGVKYYVQRGDNLSKIAKQFNSKVKWIQDANQISDPTNIQIGQELIIPQN